MRWSPAGFQVLQRAAVRRWATVLGMFTVATVCVYAWTAGQGVDPTSAPEFLGALAAVLAGLVKLARVVRVQRPRTSTPAERAAWDAKRHAEEQGKDHRHPDLELRLGHVERELGVVQDAVVTLQDTQGETQRTLTLIRRRQDDEHRVLLDVRNHLIRVDERMDRQPEQVADLLEGRFEKVVKRHFAKQQPTTVLEPDVTELPPPPPVPEVKE